MPNGKARVLVQLDPDAQASVFDAVVAIDAGVDQLLRHGGVRPEQVRNLVYGALFTRKPSDLASSAIFVGGSDVQAGEALFRAVKETFFGPFRVSVLFDANGANTTAAAAVLAAQEGMGGKLQGVPAAVLAATGPVGQRVARLLARLGADVSVGSRKIERAEMVAEAVRLATGQQVHPFATETDQALARALADRAVIVAAGTTGVRLLPLDVRRGLGGLKVAIDVNAVPPEGIEGIPANDRGNARDGLRTWGALGVGAAKMKIHKQAIQDLFTSNEKILDAEEILELGQTVS